MADPITTILTTAIEHAPNAAAVGAAYKAAKDFLAKVAGPAVEELGEIGRDYVKGWRAKNGSTVLAEADKLLAEVGREPQAVPLKTLLPLLDAASLEDDTLLVKQWAALLANAADPAQQAPVQPGFAEALRQLTPLDAQVLAVAAAIKTEPKIHIEHYVPAHMVWLQFQSVDQSKFYVVISNLIRLGLLMGVAQQPVLPGHFLAKPPNYSSLGPGIDHIRLTRFGLAFLAAVTPPTP